MTRLLAAAAALTALFTTACTADNQAAEDAQQRQAEELQARVAAAAPPIVDGTHVARIQLGGTWVITGCHDGTRVYVRDVQLAVIPNDPTCQETP